MKLPKDPKKIFLYFIHEREAIRLKKEQGLATPWTKDDILGKFRFCNVNREHDAVTEWIDRNIRRVFKDDPSLWFTLIVARLMNQPSTLGRIYGIDDGGYGAEWDKKWFLKMTDPDTQPKPIFNAAYIVSTNGQAVQKNIYVAEQVLDPIWDGAGQVHAEMKDLDWSCQEWADWLLQFNGMGDFMVNQIVTDYKYTALCCDASDRSTFVMGGPGTRRGLNRYFGRDKSNGINRGRMQMELKQIRRDILPDCDNQIARCFSYDLNNLSNCFCEYDKYMRALSGDGKPKQRYIP